MIDYEENDRVFLVESAIKNSTGSKEEILLYEQLSLAMELMENNEFDIAHSNINNGIDFGITTKFPHPLPEQLGTMFFSISPEFDVSIRETSQCVYAGERYFAINIKKS